MKSSILPASVDISPGDFDSATANEPESDPHDILTLDAVPPNVADALIKVYIEKVLPQYPFFLEEDLYLYQALVYHGAKTVNADLQRRAEFVVTMMMAISTLTSKSPNHHRLMSFSQSLYRFAMQRYDTLSASTLCHLQCTMLLCQFANFCPAIAEVWTLKGMAVRMAIALGLHKEPDAALGIFDQKQSELRRQIFWTLYSMDRSISITAHRAVSIEDDLVDVGWPYQNLDAEVLSLRPGRETQTIRFLRHVRFRQIQSEIFAVNFQSKDPSILPYSEWMKAKDAELMEWRRSLDMLHDTGFDWFDFVTYTGQLYLHMHCPRNPHPDTTSVLTGFDAVNGIADGYLRMLHRGFLKFDWHCAHQATAAGVLLIRSVKDHYQTLLRCHSSREVNDVLDKYSEILMLLTDRWPTASVCQQKFEGLKHDLFVAFSLSADILLNSGAAAQRIPSGDSVPTSLTAPGELPLATFPLGLAATGEQTATDADQVFDTTDLDSWAYTINVFRDYTDQDWDIMAGQAEMHWPF
ncbi:hypothetical protein A1O1_03406 [Capronia coronata CBS 617.96]|uniref:Xylanolytic transcriptional activator regulatory domain-containing protein n=1 Tax=Capronia coronata CBS 617.96 TaxID=1182541 RepID=W9YBS4_9EURO|nr:uncharacterized protein A1O1_03406 [Capronia coronata CBS 617.96]EXJ90307.1 hypothetical protein A1O1_03406 [Capronia coronata CBS 617.96]